MDFNKLLQNKIVIYSVAAVVTLVTATVIALSMRSGDSTNNSQTGDTPKVEDSAKDSANEGAANEGAAKTEEGIRPWAMDTSNSVEGPESDDTLDVLVHHTSKIRAHVQIFVESVASTDRDQGWVPMMNGTITRMRDDIKAIESIKGDVPDDLKETVNALLENSNKYVTHLDDYVNKDVSTAAMEAMLTVETLLTQCNAITKDKVN